MSGENLDTKNLDKISQNKNYHNIRTTKLQVKM